MAETLFRDPQFDALRNALYHTERRNFLDLLNRSLNFIVILLGAGVVGKIASLIHVEDSLLEFGVVFFATVQLVFDFGGRARVHEFLQRRYYEMLAEMENENISDEKIKAKWSARLLTISAEEPMPMRALDAMAYNKALSAVYDDPETLAEYRQHVSWIQRRLRHIFAFHGSKFPPEAKIHKRGSRREGPK
jgi:hypothetical protein